MSFARGSWLVARREFRERVRSRSFLAWTAVIVAAAFALVAGTQLLPRLLDDEPARLGVTSATPVVLREAIRESSTALDVPVELVVVSDRAAGEAAVRAGDLDALLVEGALLIFEHEERTSLSTVVTRALLAESLPRRLESLGLTLEEARPLLSPEPVAVDLLDPPLAAADTGATREERYVVANASAALLYIALAVYGGFVLNGVIEEKSNRVVEVLLGALRPAELLAGKVFGIVAVAMVQLIAGGAGVAAALIAVGGAEIPSVALDVAVYGVVWFVLGVGFYNFAYAAVGATVSRPSEAQNAAWPITMLLLVPYMLTVTLIPGRPDGVLARVLSMLPVTAPLVMPSRVAIGHPAVWELVLSFALMVPALFGIVWLAGRVYRATILRSGPRTQLLQAFRDALRSQ